MSVQVRGPRGQDMRKLMSSTRKVLMLDLNGVLHESIFFQIFKLLFETLHAISCSNLPNFPILGASLHSKKCGIIPNFSAF